MKGEGAQSNHGCLVADPLTLINDRGGRGFSRSLFKRGSQSEDDIIAHFLVEMPATMDLDPGMSFGLQV